MICVPVLLSQPTSQCRFLPYYRQFTLSKLIQSTYIKITSSLCKSIYITSICGFHVYSNHYIQWYIATTIQFPLYLVTYRLTTYIYILYRDKRDKEIDNFTSSFTLQGNVLSNVSDVEKFSSVKDHLSRDHYFFYHERWEVV